MSALSTTASNTSASTASWSVGCRPAVPSKELMGVWGGWWCPRSSDSTMGSQTRASTTVGAHHCLSCRNVKCGSLLCLSDKASPVLGGGSYRLFFGHCRCKVLIANNEANEAVAKLRLVPTGAKQGEEMVSMLVATLGWRGRVTSSCGNLEQPQSPPRCLQVCYAGCCQNLLVYGNKNCSAKCNSHGVHHGIIPPKEAMGPGQQSWPLWHIHHPGPFLPHLRCATTSRSVTVSWAGQHPTVTRSQGWWQVQHPLCRSSTGSLSLMHVSGREPAPCRGVSRRCSTGAAVCSWQLWGLCWCSPASCLAAAAIFRGTGMRHFQKR